MKSTSQRKRVIFLAAAFMALGVLAANVEARPKDNHRGKAKAQQRDRGRGRHRVERRRHRDRDRHYRDRDRNDSRWSIGFSLGTGHGRTARHVRTGGYIERRWVAPVYKTRWDGCGRKYRVVIREGYWEKIWVPYRRPIRRHRDCTSRCGAGCHHVSPGIRISGNFRF